MSSLQPKWSTALPLAEVSAVAVRGGTERPELVVVGDEDFSIVTAQLGADGRPAEAHRHELAPVLEPAITDVKGGSDYEGLAVDGDGHVLILQERASRVLVFDPDLARLRQTITLVVRREDGEFARDWTQDEPKSRGEAMLLLREGRLLVAKQGDPVALIEFGPPGAPARGLSAETFCAPEEAFAFAAGAAIEYVVLRAWELDDDAARVLPSINGLALDLQRRPYAISSQSRRIARLEGAITEPGDRVEVKADWSLPDEVASGKDDRAEGLARLPDGSLVVAVDAKPGRDNLVALALP